MAKIGTAHIEVKPVLNQDALDGITNAIEQAVRDGIAAALLGSRPSVVDGPTYVGPVTFTDDEQSRRRAASDGIRRP